ncbi:xaa-Arg dipeptidase-like [Amblyomma americanum]
MSLPENVCDEVRQLSEELWACPEASGDEQFAQQLLCDMLRTRDFFVMPGYLLPTAFCAELVFTEDAGPTVCLVCDYDAVASLGHAWGNNLASAASMAAALTIQMEAAKMVPGIAPCRGRLRVLGTPSEMCGEGKALLLDKNAFSKVDAVLATRPALGPGMVFYGTPCATYTRVTYHGRETSAVLSPWEGINAMDAAVAAYRNVALVRRDLPQQWHVAGVLRPSECSPLRVPDRCRLELFGCTPSAAELLELQKRLRSACMGPCHSTGCMVSFDYQRPYVDMMANETLGQLFLDQTQRAGVTARLFGAGTAHQQMERQQQWFLPSGLGAVSHSMPTLCPLFALDAEPPLSAASACCTDDAFERCLQAGRCLALTALALLRDASLVHKVRRSFREQKANRGSCAGSTLASEYSDSESLTSSRKPGSMA